MKKRSHMERITWSRSDGGPIIVSSVSCEVWECPKCGTRVTGPAGVRGAARRCRDCTARTGHAVLRTTVEPDAPIRIPSPRLQHLWGGLDLHAELARLVALCPEDVQVRPPSLLLHMVDGAQHLVGEANFTARTIRAWLWPTLPLGSVLATLVHELAHFCAPTDHRHGDRFRTAMLELARDAYGIVITWDRYIGRIAHLDWLVEDALCRWHYEQRKALACKG